MVRQTLRERLDAPGTGTESHRAQRDIEAAIDALLRYAITSQLHAGPALQLDFYGEG